MKKQCCILNNPWFKPFSRKIFIKSNNCLFSIRDIQEGWDFRDVCAEFTRSFIFNFLVIQLNMSYFANPYEKQKTKFSLIKSQNSRPLVLWMNLGIKHWSPTFILYRFKYVLNYCEFNKIKIPCKSSDLW